MNKNIFENYMDIYIDNKKIKFDYKYKIKDTKEIKVKFIFKKILTNTMCMFFKCSSLKSIDLSSFNTTNVNNMSRMFFGCSSLKRENIRINNKDDKLLSQIKIWIK